MSQVVSIKCDSCGELAKPPHISYPATPPPGWGQIKIEFDKMRVEWRDACPKCIAKARKLLEDFEE